MILYCFDESGVYTGPFVDGINALYYELNCETIFLVSLQMSLKFEDAILSRADVSIVGVYGYSP
jgi:hypothetical protein